MITFVFVLYSDYHSFDNFLLAQKMPFEDDVLVIVVDNTEAERVNSELPHEWERSYGVRYLRPPSGNVGYAGGAQCVIDSIDRVATSDYLCLANTDLVFEVSDVAARLRARADKVGAREVGAIAPRLTGVDGKTVRQLHLVRRPSSAAYLQLARIYSFYPLAAIHRLLADAKRSMRSATLGHIPDQIFAPHGALIIVTRRYLERTRQFRFPTFLFCEEAFVGIECETKGLACIYEPSITYSHVNHGSMGHIPSRRIIRYLRDAHATAAEELART